MSNGTIFWNLPSHLAYAPGTVLPMVAYLHNYDIVPHTYALKFRVWQNEQVTNEDSITIDGESSIVVQPGDTKVLYESILVPATNVTLELAVMDVVADAQVDSTTVSLLGEAPSGSMLQTVPAFAGVLMVGSVAKNMLL